MAKIDKIHGIKPMEINEIKTEMEAFIDFFGDGLFEKHEIKDAETLEELAEIIDSHHSQLEMRCNDAQNHLERFKTKMGLNGLTNRHK